MSLLAPAARPTAPMRNWASPLRMTADLDPSFVVTPALRLIDAKLHRVFVQDDARMALSMPPQEGKSRLASRAFALWALWMNRDLRIAIISAGDALANELGGQIKDDVLMWESEHGLRLKPDTYAKGHWKVQGGRGGVISMGIGGMLSGRPVDLLLIDDPFKGQDDTESKLQRDRVMSWYQKVGEARLGTGASVCVTQTRWHEEDLIGQLLKAEDGHRWDYLNIPAQADHNPDDDDPKKRTDPLGREPGEFMVSARGRSAAQWQLRKVAAGSNTWAALYQGRPTPAGGDVFKSEWWQKYQTPQWLERTDGSRIALDATAETMISCDFTFKDKASSDYVVMQVWMRRGAHAYLVDQVRGRMDFPATLSAFVALQAKWPEATLKLIEDAANGPAVIASLSQHIVGIVPEIPQGSKLGRARAASPLVEAHNVYLPDPSYIEEAHWVSDFIREHEGFPYGSHDDQVDASSMALNRLLLQPLLTVDDGPIEPDDFTELDERGWGYSPF